MNEFLKKGPEQSMEQLTQESSALKNMAEEGDETGAIMREALAVDAEADNAASNAEAAAISETLKNGEMIKVDDVLKKYGYEIVAVQEDGGTVKEVRNIPGEYSGEIDEEELANAGYRLVHDMKGRDVVKKFGE